MLGQRRRRWPNTETTVFQRLVLTVKDGPTLKQHWYNALCSLGHVTSQHCIRTRYTLIKLSHR